MKLELDVSQKFRMGNFNYYLISSINNNQESYENVFDVQLGQNQQLYSF